jgi:hypothetical protein
MKITLPESFIRSNEKVFKSVLKILEVRNKSTLIEIKGHQFDVPFILEKNLKYQAVIKDGVLDIVEIKKLKETVDEKNIVKEILENIFQINDKSNDNVTVNLFNMLRNIFNPDINKKKKKNYFFRDKNKGMVFIFDIFLFDRTTKLFLRLLGRNIFLFFYNDELEEGILKEFKINLEKHLFEKYKEMVFEIKFFDKKEKFYDNISVVTSNIDIKI